MPVTVAKINNLYRVVEAATGQIAKTPNGKPRDGGGHAGKARPSAHWPATPIGFSLPRAPLPIMPLVPIAG